MMKLPQFKRPVDLAATWSISQGFAAESIWEPVAWRIGDKVGYGAPPAGARVGHFHNGVDYAVAAGSRVCVPGSGHVRAVGISSTGFGLRVVVASHGWLWLCAHLSEAHCSVGDFLEHGAVFGLSGGAPGLPESGNSTGPHCHFSVLGANGLVGESEVGPYANPVPFVLGGTLLGWEGV